MQVTLCDGCEQRLEDDDYQPNQLARSEFVKDHPDHLKDLGWVNLNDGGIESFCTLCIEHANDFWVSKARLNKRIWSQVTNTLKNHKVRFFERAHTIQPTDLGDKMETE